MCVQINFEAVSFVDFVDEIEFSFSNPKPGSIDLNAVK